MDNVDISLLGATGFTGGLTADYLGANLPEGARWSIAGRNADKLQAVAARIAASGGLAPTISVVDVNDPAAMRSLAESTRVLITTVGPYVQFGEPAVRAAAEAGIAYVDLTGEPEFVDQMWLKYHATAQETGARIVHACGFDSIPYDLGVLYTVSQLPSSKPMTVSAYVRAGASFSGGTFHSALGAFARVRQSAKIAAERKKAEPRPSDKKVRGGGKIGRGADGKGWALPLPTIDPQIVLRSARALDAYGPDFTYRHFAQFKRLPMLAATVVGGVGLVAAAQLKPTRALIGKAVKQGEGPSEAKRASSWFKVTLMGEAHGQRVVTTVSGGDPGYDETAKMLSESAMCLAYDDGLPAVSGQLTTAVAMGEPLIRRLQSAGITFTTH